MALTISTGFVVDDAIVMIENISRYLEGGMAPLEAALKGAAEIGFTILSLTISLIAVLIPLLFMGDIVGRLFREFAVTLGATILVSAIVSLTLTPMMCAKLLSHKPPAQQNRVSRAPERAFETVITLYGKTLHWVLAHQSLTLLVAGATLLVTSDPVSDYSQGLLSRPRYGRDPWDFRGGSIYLFSGHGRATTSLSQSHSARSGRRELILVYRVDGTNTTINSGRIQINLKPLADRKSDATTVIHRLQPQLARISGITLYMQPVQDLTVEDRVGRTQYQYTLEDPDAKELETWTPRIVAKLQSVPELRDVASDQQNLGSQASLGIDRNTASRLGITQIMIDQICTTPSASDKYRRCSRKSVSIMSC
jgi:multidrug efflux pump